MVSAILLAFSAVILMVSSECPKGSISGDSGQKCYKLAGSHSSISESASACRDLSTDGHRFNLLRPADISDSISILEEFISVWRMQGKPDGVCWLDSDGNEIEDVDPVDLYLEDDAFPTLVSDKEREIVKQVGSNETFPFICQSEAPPAGCPDEENVLQEEELCFRFQLQPSSYDKAIEDCSSRNESLIAPENIRLAFELLNGVDFTQARLNAVANETCFLEPDGEKIDLEEIFGDEFTMDIPAAPSSGFIMVAGNGEEKPFVLQEQQLLTTICVMDVEGQGGESDSESGSEDSDDSSCSDDRNLSQPACDRETVITKGCLNSLNSIIDLDDGRCHLLTLLELGEPSVNWCYTYARLKTSQPGKKIRFSVQGFPLQEKAILRFSILDKFRDKLSLGEAPPPNFPFPGCMDQLNMEIPADEKTFVEFARPPHASTVMQVAVELAPQDPPMYHLACSENYNDGNFTTPLSLAVVDGSDADPETGCTFMATPGYPARGYYPHMTCEWALTASGTTGKRLLLSWKESDNIEIGGNVFVTDLLDTQTQLAQNGNHQLSSPNAGLSILWRPDASGFDWGFKMCVKEIE